MISEVEQDNVTDVYIDQNSAVPTGTVSFMLKDEDAARSVNVSDVDEVETLLEENGVVYELSAVPEESVFTTVLLPC